MCRLLPAILLIVAIPAALLRGQDAQKELDKFQGNWTVIGMVANGKKVPKEFRDKITVTFKADKMTMDAPDILGSKIEWTVKLDPSKNPKTLDATSLSGKDKGQTYLGIYKFENDELRICLPKLPGKDRPSEFKAPAESQLTLLYLEKPEK